MSYQLTESGDIRKELADGFALILPATPNGTPAWAEYQAWLDAGNTPLPYVPPGYEDTATAQTSRTNEINTEAHGLLAPSDWMVIRAGEGGDPVPPEWAAYRQGIRDEANTCVARVDSATSIPEVQAVTPVWPITPAT